MPWEKIFITIYEKDYAKTYYYFIQENKVDKHDSYQNTYNNYGKHLTNCVVSRMGFKS